jgi:hypothetical protein
MSFFRGYDASELDERGEPRPLGPGPAIFTLIIVALVVALVALVQMVVY